MEEIPCTCACNSTCSCVQVTDFVCMQSSEHVLSVILFIPYHVLWLLTDTVFRTRRANAQMIHIRHTYRTSSQSSPLHNQPSWAFALLHTTLQQNDCTSSQFPITLWPSVNIQKRANACSQYTSSYFPCFTSYSKAISSPHQISSWSEEKCARKWSQEVLLHIDLVTHRQGQGQWKCFLFFLRSPAISLGVTTFGWDFCVCDRFLIQPLR